MGSAMKFIFKRLLVMIPLLFAVTLVSYVLISVTPGDPLAMYVNQDLMRTMTTEQKEAKREQLGLNEPIMTRYFHWLDDILHGDFGKSFKTGQPIAKEIGQRIGLTVSLSFITMALNYLLGIPLGIHCAKNKNGLVDNSVMLYAYVGISLPSFWISILAISLFAVHLGWLPSMSFPIFVGVLKS